MWMGLDLTWGGSLVISSNRCCINLLRVCLNGISKKLCLVHWHGGTNKNWPECTGWRGWAGKLSDRREISQLLLSVSTFSCETWTKHWDKTHSFLVFPLVWGWHPVDKTRWTYTICQWLEIKSLVATCRSSQSVNRRWPRERDLALS